MISRNGLAGSARGTVARDREDAVVARLHDLAPHLDGEPDPAFRDAMRARLVAMAAVRSPEPEAVSPLRRLLAARAVDASAAPWRARLTAGLAGAALTVTALSTLVALADGARPGDVLYGLKRGTEQTQVALAGDSRGRTLLELASTRLGELQYLVSEGATALPAAGAPTGSATPIVLAAGADPELVVDTLQTMDAHTTEGAGWLTEQAVTTEDGGPLADLASWTSAQSAGLTALAGDVPPAARDELDDSLALLTGITARVADLTPALDCAGGPATDGSDALGPRPGSCDDDGAPTPPVAGGEPGTTAPGTDGGSSGGASSSGPTGGPSTGVPGGSSGGPGPGGGDTDTPGTGTPDVPDLPDGGVLPTPLPAPLDEPTIIPPLPGTNGGASSSSTSRPSLDADVCLGPIRLGDC